MTTATPASVTPDTQAIPTVADMTTAQLAEKMTKLAERHDVLKASVSEFETVKSDLSVTMAEFSKRIGPITVPAPVKAKSSTKTTPSAPRQKKEGDTRFPSLKEVVLTILGKNPNGLDLNGIRVEVQGMIDRKEYHSKAVSLSAVISQAVNALKGEDAIIHDRESKKYSKKAA